MTNAGGKHGNWARPGNGSSSTRRGAASVGQHTRWTATRLGAAAAGLRPAFVKRCCQQPPRKDRRWSGGRTCLPESASRSLPVSEGWAQGRGLWGRAHWSCWEAGRGRAWADRVLCSLDHHPKIQSGERGARVLALPNTKCLFLSLFIFC